EVRRGVWRADNVGRFAAAMEGHGGPAYYYLITVLIGLTPWCVLLVPAVWRALRDSSVTPRPEFSRGALARASAPLEDSGRGVTLESLSALHTAGTSNTHHGVNPISTVIR